MEYKKKKNGAETQEHKKKKNDSKTQDQKRFMVIACILILVLLFGCGLLLVMLIPFGPAPHDGGFSHTWTSIAVTNQHLSTLIVQTDVAATEQFMLTGTVLP